MKHIILIRIAICLFLLSGCGTPPVESPGPTVTSPPTEEGIPPEEPATPQEEPTVEAVSEMEPTPTTVPPSATATNVPPTATATKILPSPTQVPALEFEIPSEMFWLQDFFFIDETRGLAVGNKGSAADTYPVIMLTTDGGGDWTEVDAGYEIGTLNSVTFTDEVTGYAAGQDWEGSIPVILRTGDGGQTWKEVIVPQTSAFVSDVYFSPAGVGWGVGFYEHAGSLLLRSEDGITWTAQDYSASEGASLFSIDFPSPDVGYAVGTGPGNPAPHIIKTTDAGVTWKELEVPLETAFLYDVLFLDDLNGVVVGGFSEDSGVILVTRDGGESWTVSRFSGSTVYLKRVFLLTSTLLVFGNDCNDQGCSGLVLMSKDKGETWVELPRLEGKVNAIGGGISPESLVAFALYTEVYSSIKTTHWGYFASNIGDD